MAVGLHPRQPSADALRSLPAYVDPYDLVERDAVLECLHTLVGQTAQRRQDLDLQ